ncbi:helix-hairpin-helix domain-containing protein [Haloferax namakaokahaiae]|uniref:Helix-hairpin-helix domain-containing protein n=1 Tax=Haloferax namakaokahaiae TaxID=1748331 RepID=A0ABD5ZGV3_9EURY
MGLLDSISSLLKSLLGRGTSSDASNGSDADATVTVERDTRREQTTTPEPNVESEAAVKEPVEETESADEEAVEPEEEAADDDEEVVIEEAEADVAEDAVSDESDEDAAESEVEPEPEDADAETDADEVEESTEDEASEPEAEAADSPSVDTVRGIGPAYAERLENIGIETVSDLVDADADAVGDDIDVSPKRVQRWIDRANEQ